jgi:hypothetical protein
MEREVDLEIRVETLKKMLDAYRSYSNVEQKQKYAAQFFPHILKELIEAKKSQLALFRIDELKEHLSNIESNVALLRTLKFATITNGPTTREEDIKIHQREAEIREHFLEFFRLKHVEKDLKYIHSTFDRYMMEDDHKRAKDLTPISSG